MRLGSFTLIDHFARGGLCNIYRAVDINTGRLAIVKRLKDDLLEDRQAVRGFQRECGLALKLEHPNLNRGLEVGDHGGVPYLIVEYIDGIDLARLWHRAVERQVEIPEACWLYVVAGILRGLAYAHRLTDEHGEQLGLVHRDISPKNIFLDIKGEVRVGDFGATYTKEDIGSKEAAGSPGYMAPEQVKFEPLYPSTDIFAVGCVLYELMTHRPAFFLSSKKTQDIVRMHSEGRIAPIPDSVPDDIAQIIRKATQPSRGDRYQSCDEMLEAVVIAQDKRPVVSPNLLLASVIRGLFKTELDNQRPNIEDIDRKTTRYLDDRSSGAEGEGGQVKLGTRPFDEIDNAGIRQPDTSTFMDDELPAPAQTQRFDAESSIDSDHIIASEDQDAYTVLGHETDRHLKAHHGDYFTFVEKMKESYAGHFDDLFWTFFEPFFASAKGHMVADFGTGPGLFVPDFIERYQPHTMYAVDGQPAMVAAARETLRGVAQAKLVELDLGASRLRSFTDETLNLINASRVLHEMQRPTVFLREISRILRPGGWFTMTDWLRHPLERYLDGRSFDDADLVNHFGEHCRYSRDDLFFMLNQAGLIPKRDIIKDGRFIFVACQKGA